MYFGEQQFFCGPGEIQMLRDRPEYPYAEILYHDALRLWFPFKIPATSMPKPISIVLAPDWQWRTEIHARLYGQ